MAEISLASFAERRFCVLCLGAVVFIAAALLSHVCDFVFCFPVDFRTNSERDAGRPTDRLTRLILEGLQPLHECIKLILAANALL